MSTEPAEIRRIIDTILVPAFRDRPLSDGRYHLYCRKMRHFTALELERSAERIIETARYFPSVSEWRRQAAEIRDSATERPADAPPCPRCERSATLRLPVIDPDGRWHRLAFACPCPSGAALARPCCTMPGCEGGESCGGQGHHPKPGLAPLSAYRDQTERRLALTLPAAYAQSLDVDGAYWLWFALEAAREHATLHGAPPAWWGEHMAEGRRFRNAGPGVYAPTERGLQELTERFGAATAARARRAAGALATEPPPDLPF